MGRDRDREIERERETNVLAPISIIMPFSLIWAMNVSYSNIFTVLLSSLVTRSASYTYTQREVEGTAVQIGQTYMHQSVCAFPSVHTPLCMNANTYVYVDTHICICICIRICICICICICIYIYIYLCKCLCI